jgi:hypothetical protein
VSRKTTPWALAVVLALAAPAAAAEAHQTTTSEGVTVTMHVTPDDEPVSGRHSQISVTRVKVRKGRFAWSSCGCRLKISDSSGATVLDRAMTSRSVHFTFPRSGAYRITFSGRVKGRNGGKSRSFSTPFAIRAA